MSNFDILEDRSMWPTLCVLESTTDILTHAITTVENFIFDSNLSGAIELNKKNLDWCCSDDFDKAEYKRIHLGYRFIKSKPRCDLLLRSTEQRQRGLNSIIQSFHYFHDLITAAALEKLRCELINEACLISQVRELVKQKEFGYRPVLLKSIDDVLNTSSHSFPSIFIIGISSSFHYEVLSSVENILHDGRNNQSVRLCAENLFYAIHPDALSCTETDSIEFIFGYTFFKDERKSK
jgi:hypothetical protein